MRTDRPLVTDTAVQIITAGCVTVALAALQIVSARRTNRKLNEHAALAKDAFGAANDTNSKFLAINETYRRHRDAQRRMEEEFRQALEELKPTKKVRRH